MPEDGGWMQKNLYMTPQGKLNWGVVHHDRMGDDIYKVSEKREREREREREKERKDTEERDRSRRLGFFSPQGKLNWGVVHHDKMGDDTYKVSYKE